MKGFFAGHSVFVQSGILMTCLLAGMILCSFFSLFFSGFSPHPGDEPVWALQLVQAVSSVGMMLIPSLLTAWLCSEHPGDFLHLRGMPDARLLGWVTLTVVLISPTVSLTGYLNMQLHLPEALAPLEARMREMEDLAAEVVGKMTAEKGLFPLLTNLFIIAFLAALTEEFLFRGTLFSIFRRAIRNPHAVIWLIAVIFSAIHCQFYGFFPRMLLGAYLGYLLYWTKNLWIAVFAHFLNNAFVIVALSNDTLQENPFFAEELAPDDLGWFSLVAGGTLILFAGCMWRIFSSAAPDGKRNDRT
ncbi:MAG: CPBP family intramembrane metalloprotease [Tannerella sp.]|jgi:membrane protease YdiL (CAAX protease family)|nr:CPBP family intramembrane metalloprotease [Tannerella sp.]